MHICFVSSEYPPGKIGGVGAFIQTLARELVKRGYKASVVGINPNGSYQEEEDFGVKVYRLNASNWKFARFYKNYEAINKKLAEIHKQSPISIIESAELGLAFIDNSLPCRKIIRMHGGHRFFATTLGKKPALWRSYQETKSFNKADAVIAVSDYVGKTTMQLLGTPNREYTVIHNPINLSKFYASDPQNEDPNKILFIGTVCEKKGIRQLIQAMPEVLNLNPNAYLEIVGRDWFYPGTTRSYTQEMKDLVASLRLNEKVIFTGAVEHDEIPSKIESAFMCVYPSHMEAMPVAWLEVLAMGKAFIGSKIGPAYEAVEDKISGLLVDPYKPADIAEKINYLFKHPEVKYKLAKMAFNKRQQFDIETLVDKNVNCYKSILA